MSIFYIQSRPDKEMSLAFVREAIQAAWPFIEYLGLAQQVMGVAKQIVQAWDLDVETFFKECLPDE